MSKHTPGPWKIRGYGGQHEESGANITATSGRRVANTAEVHDYHSPESWQEYYANARLIAAAPDLLAACTMALENLGATLGTGSAAETFGALRAAIAKAEGAP